MPLLIYLVYFCMFVLCVVANKLSLHYDISRTNKKNSLILVKSLHRQNMMLDDDGYGVSFVNYSGLWQVEPSLDCLKDRSFI